MYVCILFETRPSRETKTLGSSRAGDARSRTARRKGLLMESLAPLWLVCPSPGRPLPSSLGPSSLFSSRLLFPHDFHLLFLPPSITPLSVPVFLSSQFAVSPQLFSSVSLPLLPTSIPPPLPPALSPPFLTYTLVSGVHVQVKTPKEACISDDNAPPRFTVAPNTSRGAKYSTFLSLCFLCDTLCSALMVTYCLETVACAREVAT